MTGRAKNNRQVFATLARTRLDSRDDRLMLASNLLGKTFDTFTDLSDAEMADLATALHDWRTIEDARVASGAATVDALQHLLNLDIPARLREELLSLCTDLGFGFSPNEDSDETTLTNSSTYTEKDI